MIGLVAAAVLAMAPSQAELTIYNQGFGLVKEVRQLKLNQGRQNVEIEDVASMIDPTSVGFHSLGDKDAFSVLEQNYQFDLINTQAILNKSVGQRIRFIRTIGNQKDVLSGVLMSAPTSIVANQNEGGGPMQTYNGMVIRTDDNRIVLNPTGEIEVSAIPPGLISKPTLMWEVDAPKATSDKVELSYISQGLSWNADYVVTLGDAGKGDMQGWVTLTNTSGATWENAKLKLLAGDVHTTTGQARQMMAKATNGGGFGGGGFQEQSLFEYHLYTLQRPATVRNNETKQISLLEGHDIPFTKRLIVDSIGYSRYYPGDGEIGTGDIKPQVRLEFVNDQASGLGMPLPKGRVRVYQRDQSGSVQLLGEDQIDHTPRNEHVSLLIGHAFDVVCSRKRTNFTRINDREVRESFEIEVRNRKVEPATVTVLERHFGDWRITDKSQDFVKADSDTAVFTLNLKPDEVKKIAYTVETKW